VIETAQKHIDLTVSGKLLRGECPFCLARGKTLFVSERKFYCTHCQVEGDKDEFEQKIKDRGPVFL